MRKKFVFSMLIIVALLTVSAIGVLEVKAAITGSTPPVTGDWIINQPTVVSSENITINGNIIVNSSLEIRDSTIWINSTNGILNVTEYGELTLRNVTIRGYNETIRWEFRVYNGAKCIIDNSKIIGAGHTGTSEQAGIWINTPNVIINNSLITDAYVGVFIEDTNNITIENTKILATYYTPSDLYPTGIRITTGDKILLKNVTVYSSNYYAILTESTTTNLEIYNSNFTAYAVPYVARFSYTYYVTVENSIFNNTNPSLTAYGFSFVNLNHAYFRNVTIESTNHAIFVGIGRYITIEDSKIISHSGDAFYLIGPDQSRFAIKNNEIAANIVVLDVRNTDSLWFESNRIITSPTRYASITSSNNITLKDNNIPTVKYGISVDSSSNVYLIDETLVSTDIMFTFTESHNITLDTCNFNSADFINSENVSGIYILNSNIVAGGYGIITENVYNSTIKGSTLTVDPSNFAISIINGSRIKLEENYIFGGVALQITGNSKNITISKNTLISNKTVYFANSSNLSVEENSFLVNQTAVSLYNITYSLFSGNVFTSNTSYGMLITKSSDYNTIYGNKFYYSSSYGIYIADGSNNLLYLNEFLGNNNNNSQVYDSTSMNNWDNGSIGNWYCNYDGPDLDHNGIGDTPYDTGPNAVDHYPIVIDNDHDGLNDYTEIITYNTNPYKSDTDNDGLNDGDELFKYNTSPTNDDSDNDSLPDGWEVTYNLDPLNASDANTDPDNDGLANFEEYELGTNPTNNDSDGDGMPDGWEASYGLNPKLDDAGQDLDNDGLTNLQEFQYNTNPKNNDTDLDGMPDGWEVTYGLNPTNSSDANSDPDNDGLTNVQEYELGTNPTNNDSDNDGIPDGWEVSHGLNPKLNDSGQDPDNDGLTNLQEFQYNTNPKSNDTDLDGMSDKWEIENNLDPTNSSDRNQDIDNDGLTNVQEYKLGTDPHLNDTDGDGLNDGDEVNVYHTDPLKADTDGDGIPDGVEVEQGTNPNALDTDGDGIPDSEDSMPTTNNYYIYIGIAGVIAAIIAVLYFVKLRKK